MLTTWPTSNERHRTSWIALWASYSSWRMFQISTRKPFKTIVTAQIHTSAAGAKDRTPGLFYVLDRMKSLRAWVRILKSGFNKVCFLNVFSTYVFLVYL